MQDNAVKVTDKRKLPKVTVVPAQQDVFEALLEKTFRFVVQQPEFLIILQYPRPVRKKFGRELGRVVSTVPNLREVGELSGPEA